MIGAEIRTLREKRGLGQRQVADHAGISLSSIKAIENGERYPTLRTLEALADCLQMTVTITPAETIVEPLS